ncbi:MAG: hypothetical protein BWY89_00705 [Bacteroidetes bacterium ADurb.BinA012]|nr:MAG: hypothetical protein BWY89_00705 [Bacteroidetes bacterium ADurb.BinA012]
MAILSNSRVRSSAVGRLMSKLIAGFRSLPERLRTHSTGILALSSVNSSSPNISESDALVLYRALISRLASSMAPFHETVPPFSTANLLLSIFPRVKR